MNCCTIVPFYADVLLVKYESRFCASFHSIVLPFVRTFLLLVFSLRLTLVSLTPFDGNSIPNIFFRQKPMTNGDSFGGKMLSNDHPGRGKTDHYNKLATIRIVLTGGNLSPVFALSLNRPKTCPVVFSLLLCLIISSKKLHTKGRYTTVSECCSSKLS